MTETKRWDLRLNEHVKSPKEIENFLADIIAVYDKHGLSISHEDGYGAFEIESENMNYNKHWLRSAHFTSKSEDEIDDRT